MPLLPGHKTNFQTLLRAATNGDLALLDCRRADTGKQIAVACAVSTAAHGEIEFVPLAHLFNDNPYETVLPPTVDEVAASP